jgi:hypothetical protein
MVRLKANTQWAMYEILLPEHVCAAQVRGQDVQPPAAGIVSGSG